jgi:hypothetical protein
VRARGSRARIEAAERALDVAIPDELRSLLLESDGVVGEYGLGLVWPDVFARNHEDDSRRWIAASLERYLGWWLSGKLQV